MATVANGDVMDAADTPSTSGKPRSTAASSGNDVGVGTAEAAVDGNHKAGRRYNLTSKSSVTNYRIGLDWIAHRDTAPKGRART